MSISLERLIIDVKESLEREMHSMEDRINIRLDGITSRLDAQAARSDRKGSLILRKQLAIESLDI